MSKKTATALFGVFLLGAIRFYFLYKVEPSRLLKDTLEKPAAEHAEYQRQQLEKIESAEASKSRSRGMQIDPMGDFISLGAKSETIAEDPAAGPNRAMLRDYIFRLEQSPNVTLQNCEKGETKSFLLPGDAPELQTVPADIVAPVQVTVRGLRGSLCVTVTPEQRQEFETRLKELQRIADEVNPAIPQ